MTHSAAGCSGDHILPADYDHRTGCNAPKAPGSLVKVGLDSPVHELRAIDGEWAMILDLFTGARVVARMDRLRCV